MDKKIRIGLVIGHNEKSKGAINKKYGIKEYSFNYRLVNSIKKKFDNNNQIKTIMCFRHDTISNLVNDLNKMELDFIISFHCNAYDTRTRGCEFLYYHKSSNGQRIADVLSYYITNLFKNRGIKPKTSEDRGGYLLSHTTSSCVIAESFFIDNDSDFEYAENNFDKLVQNYYDAIVKVCINLFDYKEEDDNLVFDHEKRMLFIKEWNNIKNEMNMLKGKIDTYITKIIFHKENNNE